MTSRAGFFSSRVVRRLLVLFLVCAVIPIALLSTATLDQVSSQLESEARERLRGACKAAGMGLVARLLDLRAWTAAGATGGLSPSIDEHVRASFLSLVEEHDGEPPRVLFGRPPDVSPELTRDVLAHLSRGMTWLATAPRPGETPAILLVQPMGDPGDTSARLVAEIDPDPLWETTLHAAVPTDAFYWVLDDSGRVLHRSPDAPAILPAPIRQARAASSTDSLTWESGGETYVGSYWSVFLKPHFLTRSWTLIVAEPRSAVLAPVALFRSVFPLASALCLGMVCLVFLIQLRRRLAPLGTLTAASQRIAERDFAVDVRVTSGDEFEDLASSFTAMAQRLNEQFDGLLQLIELDRAILSTIDERHIVGTLATGVRIVTGCERVAVFTEESDRPGVLRVSLEPEGVHARAELFNEEQAQRLLSGSDGIEVDTVGADWPTLRCLAEQGMRRVWLLPISLERRLAGAVAIDLEGVEALDSQARVFARQLTDQASVAVTNARTAERNRVLAQFDSLTGLPNRLLFGERLEQALIRMRRPGQRVGVGLLDLDSFKRVNDTLGHGAGDDLLRQVTDRLGGDLRQGTLARMGGDEFTFIVSDLEDADVLARLARRLLDSLEAPFRVSGREVFVNASIGLAVAPHDGRDVETLLRNADAAMYHAKARTGNAFRFYDTSMNEIAVARLELEHEIRRGLERGEFIAYYQPIVETVTRAIVGVEALARWQHPERGLIPPAHFIPLAEETGLIVPLGQQILESACRDLGALARENPAPLRLSVNLSVRQLAEPDIVDRVRRALDLSGWPASQLVLEVTETMLMSPDPESNAVLQQLRRLGAAISIDDFGSGYSSLAYLKHFDADHLKIDQAFVSDLETDPDDAAITAAILAMARGLGMGVVAEGVESEAQLDFLRQRGCDWVQGYLFAEPIPIDALRKWVRDQDD